MENEKKRYWLKLEKDFLKSTQIKVIKNMPNGKDYVLFYLALMLESVETVGHLKFSDAIPYNEEMLAVVTDTNVDVVRSAVKIFEQLGMIQKLDDGTVFMPSVPKMTGKESESAGRVRNFREKQKQLALQCNNQALQCDYNVQNSNAYSEYNKEEDKQTTEKKKIKNNISDFFESVWKIYPNKKGKGQISDTQKNKLHTIGLEQLQRCIERYKRDKPEWQAYQNGSTFFNSGYVDYLDDEYVEQAEVEEKWEYLK